MREVVVKVSLINSVTSLFRQSQITHNEEQGEFMQTWKAEQMLEIRLSFWMALNSADLVIFILQW